MESKPPQDTESRHADKYIVRFPDGMRDRLKEEARANNRTLNAEIVARLQASLVRYADTTMAAKGSSGTTLFGDPAQPWPTEVTERFEAIARKAGEVAAERVLAATGIDLVRSGTASIVQGPPPEPEGKRASRAKGREQ